MASLATVHFPWGSLLDAAIGRDPAGIDRLGGLVAQDGSLRLLLSAAERDATRGVMALDPGAVADAYAVLGFAAEACRLATLTDVQAARSSWGRRLLSAAAGERRAWLIDLRRVESGGGGALHRLRT
jgi:hypothetical protein